VGSKDMAREYKCKETLIYDFGALLRLLWMKANGYIGHGEKMHIYREFEL